MFSAEINEGKNDTPLCDPFLQAAWAGASNTTDGLLQFMATHAGGLTCAKDPLGCGGYKITCNWGASESGGVGTDKQLHYVVADRLPSQAVDGDNLGVDGWVREAMSDMGDMREFTAMMHNKVQLFMLDLEKQITDLEESGFSLMFRKSRNTDGVLMGHVLVPVGCLRTPLALSALISDDGDHWLLTKTAHRLFSRRMSDVRHGVGIRRSPCACVGPPPI